MNGPESAAPYTGKRILEAMHEAVIYTRTIFELIKAARPSAAQAILEFGAGDGAFVKKFRDEGVQIDCVEVDHDLRSELAQLTPRVYRNIREIADGSCDFIYSVNVLEHISGLENELSELTRKLRPPSGAAGSGGVVFIFVPAFRLLWTSLDTEAGHVTRFTRGSLRKALESSSLEVMKMEYFDSLGFPAALAVRALEALNLFTYGGASVKFYDRRIFPVSRALDSLTRHIFGKNLVAVARRIQAARPANGAGP